MPSPDDISQNTGDNDAHNRQGHDSSGFLTDSHTYGGGGWIGKQGHIVDVIQLKQQAQCKNACCAGNNP